MFIDASFIAWFDVLLRRVFCLAECTWLFMKACLAVSTFIGSFSPFRDLKQIIMTTTCPFHSLTSCIVHIAHKEEQDTSRLAGHIQTQTVAWKASLALNTNKSLWSAVVDKPSLLLPFNSRHTRPTQPLKQSLAWPSHQGQMAGV